MSRTKLHKLSYFFLLLIFFGCATHNVNYNKADVNWNKNSTLENEAIEHTFYLIGDGGKMDENSVNDKFNFLKSELQKATINSTLLFLGDNIYDDGMPKKKDPSRAEAETILDAQISLSNGFDGKTIFIPGNHDYYNDGIKGLKREANYITKKLGDKKAFLPENGCPIEKINVSDSTVLLIIDSQWYLENWDKNPTMNDDCEIKTREQFFLEYQSLVKKNRSKTILVALHHPMYSNGSHGGQFSARQHLFPSNNYNIPLPVFGSIINVLRKTSGISPQDLQNKIYLEFQNRITTISQEANDLVFLSGHEHSLQYIEQNNLVQIISGSGSKATAARVVNGGEFSYGGIGYAKIELLKSGSAWVYFYTEENNEQKLLYKVEVVKAIKKEEIDYPADGFPEFKTTSIYTKEEVKKSKTHNALLGKKYRYVYGTDVTVPVVNLDTLFGGLTPIRKGGGMQSKSVRLKDINGKEYVMRALKKSATQFFQAAAFKNDYIGNQYNDTYTEDLMYDLFTTAHPYTPFIIGELGDSSGIYHTNPKLYYIPKQAALGKFNVEFGDELYMVEERPTDGHGDLESFGFSNKIISTHDMLKKIRTSDDNKVDEASYIRARLFDMLVGDWDRHQDQWRWAAFKNGKKTTYKPIPRDRDQAFSKYDGFLLQVLTRIVYDVGKMQTYDEDIRNIKKFNLSGHPLDVALINEASYELWQEQVDFIQKNITNESIEKAFVLLPNEIQDKTIDDIKSKLKIRLTKLDKIAKEYFDYLARYIVVKGNDKDNWFVIDRKPNGSTHIKVYNIKDSEKGSKIHNKVYPKETKEIWVYGLDDKDLFEVNDNSKNVTPLILIGGQNNDEYRIGTGKKVKVYDFKSKKNTFTTNNGKLNLTNDYELNTYDYKKLKHRRNMILPLIGYNPDDGVNLGVKNVATINGYQRNPFSQQHEINAYYYFATNGFYLDYRGEFAHVFKDWNFLFEGKFTSPNYSVNFYGFGNDTYNFEDDFDDNYHRVRFSAYGAYPSLKWIGRMGGEFKGGLVYESIEVEKTAGRFVENLPYVTEERQNYLGAEASYKYENKDHNAFPTLGFIAELDLGYKNNVDNSDQFAYLKPSIGIAYKLDTKGKVVLASKLKGNIIIGSDYEFYYGASIGGKDGLRGYRNQRFTGDQSFYQNTDLRFDLGGFKTSVLPIRLGVFGGFDYGRVWLDGENSNDWKTSVGGGLWLVGADMMNINLSAFNSDEGTYFSFGLGFGF